MPERDDLDRLIDSELDRYAEPRTGLEQRILSRVEAEPSARSWIFGVWQRWALAAAIAAAVILSIQSPHVMHRETSSTAAHTATPEHGPSALPKATTPESEIQLRAVPKVASTTHHFAGSSKTNRVANRTTRPKLDIFPAPQPLSQQELALLAIATAPSGSARENLIASQHQLDAPLQISAIEIPAITAPDEGRK